MIDPTKRCMVVLSTASRDRLVLDTQPYARRWAARYAGPMLCLEDATAEAYLGLVEAAATYDPTQPWRPWARLWILRRLFEAIRRSPIVRVPESAHRRGIEAPPVGELRDAPDGQEGPEVQAAVREVEARAAAVLSPREVRVLSLRRAGYTLREVGEGDGCGRERIRQIQARALKRLAAMGLDR